MKQPMPELETWPEIVERLAIVIANTKVQLQLLEIQYNAAKEIVKSQ